MEGIRIIGISTVVKLFAFHINHVISQSMRTSRKEVVHDIFSIIPRAILDVKRSCSRQKSPLSITKARTNKSISELINRCVMTKIDVSVRISGKIFQRGNLGLNAVV